MKSIYIPISPVSKPRMTKRDRWSKRPAVLKYWKFKDDLSIVRDDLASFIGENHDVQITFGVQIPKSYSKKKTSSRLLEYHKQRPDIDNFLKGLLDATMDEDSGVASVFCQKIWCLRGCICVTKGLELGEIKSIIKGYQTEVL